MVKVSRRLAFRPSDNRRTARASSIDRRCAKVLLDRTRSIRQALPVDPGAEGDQGSRSRRSRSQRSRCSRTVHRRISGRCTWHTALNAHTSQRRASILPRQPSAAAEDTDRKITNPMPRPGMHHIPPDHVIVHQRLADNQNCPIRRCRHCRRWPRQPRRSGLR